MKKKIIELSFSPVFSLTILKRQIFAVYDHYIMRFALDENTNAKSTSDWLITEKISLSNIADCENQNFYIGRMRKYLLEMPELVDGFLFYEKLTHRPVGFIWLMYRGGNEFQYKIRKVDAFFFDVFVNENFRGRGVCGTMLMYMFEYLRSKGVSSAGLGVRTNNKSAIRAYEKAGGRIVNRRRFIMIFRRYNFPYFSV